MSDTTDSMAQDVIRGALYTWGTLDHSTWLKAGDSAGSLEIQDGSGRVLATVRRDDSPLGRVWYIALGDRRERVLPSVVTALRYLRGHICPERESGRVLFGQGESQ